MPLKPAQLHKKVKQWIKYADEDLRLAQHALTLSSSCPFRLIAYHAQQCAEKCLKAYLVYHLIDFPYTHDIQNLLELCSRVTAWPKSLKAAHVLTAYSTTARYPGIVEATKKEALHSIALAVQVQKAVLQTLTKENKTFKNPVN